jgi:hypothetical protein
MSMRDYKLFRELCRIESSPLAALWYAMDKSSQEDFERLTTLYPDAWRELKSRFDSDPEIQAVQQAAGFEPIQETTGRQVYYEDSNPDPIPNTDD